jgi:NADPH-dependent 2,4-dienoyl-CoA reductase/sulfur reductase-like enzyme
MSAVDALKPSYELAVIGAGPAGMAAAVVAAQRGVATILFDEQASPGGQIYRGVTTTPLRRRELLGDDYWHGQGLVDALLGCAADYAPRSIVWAVTRIGDGFELAVSRDGVAHLLRVAHLIVATGAQERPFPIPGWTLPGVMTVGAAQILLKTAGLVPGDGTVVAGSGPLLPLVLAQFAAAGVSVDAVLDTTPRDRRWRAAWRDVIGFATSPYLAKGVALLRRARAAGRVGRGVESLEAIGDHRIERVRYRAGGQTIELACTSLLLHQGVVPNINFANAIGCEQRWDEVQACFVPVVDAWGASSVPGVTLAGDGAGIAGARAAEAHGRIAALNAACAIGRIDSAQRDAAGAPAQADRARWLRGRRFLDVMYRPAPQYRIPVGDTVVCRCEEVTARQVLESVRLGCTGPNQMKSFLRCGMGPCQGRFCGLTVSELIAKERGSTPAEIGHYRLRFPIKPITLGELASLPQTEASEQAVVRLPK